MNNSTLCYSLPLAGIGLLLAMSAPVSGQFGGSSPKIATASAVIQPATLKPGGKGVFVVTLAVKPKYHVNAVKPNDPAYIPTAFTPQPIPGLVFGPARFPAARSLKVGYSAKPLLVYTGSVRIAVPFTVTQAAKLGVKTLAGSVSFQGCDAKSCYPPASASVKARLTIK